MLIFSKYVYLASLSSYYTFYLIEVFGVSIQGSQILLFVFLGAVAAGALLGGSIGDRIGRKAVMWVSILGVLPFTFALPYRTCFGKQSSSAFTASSRSPPFSTSVAYLTNLFPDPL